MAQERRVNHGDTDPFNTGADVHFVGKPPDWREELADEVDPDDELIETPEDVKQTLGFDPADDEDEDEDESE